MATDFWDSGNQGATGRPARAHEILRLIFAKDQALQAWRALRGFFPREGSFLLAEGFLPWRGIATRQGVSDATRNSAKDQAEGLGEALCLARLLPHEAISTSAEERTWALRHVQDDARAYAR